MKNRLNIKKIILISILSALSLILYIAGPKFPLPIFPSFLEINFSMLPVFIALFSLGTKDAFVVSLIRFFLKLPFTSTAYVGEISDLIIASTTIILSGISFYILKGDKYKYQIVLILSIPFWIFGGILANLFSLPLYIEMFGGKEVIVAAMSMIPGINIDNYLSRYILFAVIPFNLLISSVVVIITGFVIRSIKQLLA